MCAPRSLPFRPGWWRAKGLARGRNRHPLVEKECLHGRLLSEPYGAPQRGFGPSRPTPQETVVLLSGATLLATGYLKQTSDADRRCVYGERESLRGVLTRYHLVLVAVFANIGTERRSSRSATAFEAERVIILLSVPAFVRNAGKRLSPLTGVGREPREYGSSDKI